MSRWVTGCPGLDAVWIRRKMKEGQDFSWPSGTFGFLFGSA